jgi:hypothetical protein
MIDTATIRQIDELIVLKELHQKKINQIMATADEECEPYRVLIDEVENAIGLLHTAWLHSGHSDFTGITLDEVNLEELQ